MYFELCLKETVKRLKVNEIKLSELNIIFVKEQTVNSAGVLYQLSKIKTKNDLLLYRDNYVIKDFFFGIINDEIYLDWNYKGTYFIFNIINLSLQGKNKIKIILD